MFLLFIGVLEPKDDSQPNNTADCTVGNQQLTGTDLDACLPTLNAPKGKEARYKMHARLHTDSAVSTHRGGKAPVVRVACSSLHSKQAPSELTR
jgi:hypothetical protein